LLTIAFGNNDLKIGARIRRARRHAKLSQVQLSAAIPVQRSAVSNWESVHEIYPTMANLVAIARICDVSLDWLGTGRGQMLLTPPEHEEITVRDAELVDDATERELLAGFRSLSRTSQGVVFDLIRALRGTRTRNATST
jgi:transcriptional regulator with XRE-family HTH domain